MELPDLFLMSLPEESVKGDGWYLVCVMDQGERIRTLRCDNTLEYEKLWRTVLPEGIVVKFTTAYTPEQNDVAERLNPTLMQMVSVMQMSYPQGKSQSFPSFQQQVPPGELV